MTEKWYVVWWCEYLRDGEETGARIVDTVDEAIRLVDKIANGFAGSNCQFKLFELGKEIPLSEGTAEKTEIVKTVRKFRVSTTKKKTTK